MSSVSLMARLEARMREAILNGDKDLADAVVDSMVRAILKDPVKAWPMLREFILRDEGPAGTDEEAAEQSQAEQERAWEEFGRYLRRLADPTGP